MGNDRFTQHMGVVALSLLALATVVGGIALAWSDRSLPGEIIAIGSGAAGVIGGAFSNLGRSNEPQPVVGVQGGPVETTLVEPDPIPSRPPRKPRKRVARDDGLTVIEALVVILIVVVILVAIGRL